jgi:hypothetical protein
MITDLTVLYCMCLRVHLSAGVCCLFGGPVFQRNQGSRLIENAGPPAGSPFSSASLSLPQFHKRGCFCPSVGCKYLHLTLSAACWVFQSVVMLGPFLWVLHSLSNGVRPWDLPLSRIPLWACFAALKHPFSQNPSPRQGWSWEREREKYMNNYISLSLSSKQREAFASDVLKFYVHQIENCVSRFKRLMPKGWRKLYWALLAWEVGTSLIPCF